jgi:hypothetical protein
MMSAALRRNEYRQDRKLTKRKGALNEHAGYNHFHYQGHRITQYKGIARGIIVRSPTIAQGMLGGLMSIIGGRIGAYAEMCEQARQQAFDLIVENAGKWELMPLWD